MIWITVAPKKTRTMPTTFRASSPLLGKPNNPCTSSSSENESWPDETFQWRFTESNADIALRCTTLIVFRTRLENSVKREIRSFKQTSNEANEIAGKSNDRRELDA